MFLAHDYHLLINMELFISSVATDRVSLAIDFYSHYLKAVQRKIVNLTVLPPSTQFSLKINELPLLVKSASGSLDGLSEP